MRSHFGASPLTRKETNKWEAEVKIKDVKTWAVANPPPHHGGTYWVFLKLTTDNGIAGYGECFGAPFAPKRVCGLIKDVVERLVAGRSPFDIENIWWCGIRRSASSAIKRSVYSAYA